MKIINKTPFIFLFFFSSQALSVECLAPPAPSSEIEKVNLYLQNSLCTLENANKNFKENNPNEFKLERLSTRCTRSWKVKTSKGVKEIPAGLNVLKGNGTKIIFHKNGEILEGEIENDAFTGKKNCSQKNEILNFEAFKEEALFNLQIAKNMDIHAKTPFGKMVLETENLLRDINPSKFTKQVKEWTIKTSRFNLNRVEQVKRYQELISKAFDPIEDNGKKNSDNTLIIPLSVTWFQSNPKLKSFFEETWLKSGYDLRITVGHSGEGVVNYSSKSNEDNSSFKQMSELIQKTKAFVLSQTKNKDIFDSPEAKWLTNLSEEKINNSKRMIFFSPDTWTRDSKLYPWAEQIPVNQSIGGLNSDYLLSVMIHEINVNSDYFLARDTHGPEEDSKALRQCIERNGIDSMPLSLENIQKLFGYNSQLEVIYLKSFLN